MKVVRTVDEMRAAVADERARQPVIGFVPTMGALHEGHLSLIRAARSEADLVVVSIFVNPLQFGPREDLSRYPRPENRDLELAEQEKADIVFMPSVEEMYLPGADVRVSAGELGKILEGAIRPGHFDGVCTVVAKLLNIVAPDVAFFGQKDAQQV
ncbi:MAG: pantoate--beta-alanine ligase, partial [Actinomycetota bacterium]|nr:pantoate--beta-alanine ligase [Actinomycetota bacterium]